MYLSQLVIDLRSRQARKDLGDRFELHRTVMSAFPDDLPENERVLFRVEEGRLEPMAVLLVQSHTLPHWEDVPRLQSDYLLHEPHIREITTNIQIGRQLNFRLQANPTVKRDGKRYALYDDEALSAWLQRKSINHGFQLGKLGFRFAKLGKKYGKNRLQVWHAVQFDGFLTVTDDSLFTEALVQGIGSAKAFGFGLLSIPYSA